ncbi:two-component system, sensor histidine kinase YesM [Paenibacillus catalpae]|uniref:histidine kinase n=1 Tax=Paenibacillus catalpae TaxID=1045775 RepID=A0A1I1SVF3_9BACL|nr:sensor histidine kinase [Paenibacillus catalpae]SFD50366.1 two-component system, sensor histidine kinase YesM [Paenibacillus catalpae]
MMVGLAKPLSSVHSESAKQDHAQRGRAEMPLLANWFNSMKLRHKLFFSYMAVILIPLTILGIYSYQQSKKLQLEQAHIVLQDNLRKIDDNLSYKLQRFNSAIELISYNPNFSQIFNKEYNSYYEMYMDLKETVDPLINTTTSLNKDIERIVIFTENNLTQRMNSIMPIASLEHEEWYKEAMQTIDTHWYARDGKVFGVRRIFGDVNYEKKNLVYVELVPSFLPGSLDLSDIKQAIAVITDPQGKVVYTTEQDSGTGFAAGKLAEMQHQEGGIPGYIWLQRQLRESNWTLSLLVPVETLTVSPWKIIRATLIIEGISVAVLLLIIGLFTRGFVRRIQRLNHKMRLVEEGTLTINLKVHASDEIGELESRFGKMLASINLLIEEGYQNKITQREAELRALQAQINPHFLYNSLSVINWKAIDAGADEISRVAGFLSTFYRTTLNQGKDHILVKDEFLNTKSYLEMQLIMHDYNFDVTYDIDEEIVEQQIIKLILQPIVENAIEHGIDQKRTGRGALRISGKLGEDNKTLVFTIEDNGPGIQPGMAEMLLTKQSRGYGLRNVHERIKVQYGSQYGITIASEPGFWTRVSITIPKDSEKQDGVLK